MGAGAAARSVALMMALSYPRSTRGPWNVWLVLDGPDLHLVRGDRVGQAGRTAAMVTPRLGC